MNSGNENQRYSPVRLSIHGLGEVVSFKNNKVIAKGRLFTKPKYADWMQKCADSFALQLLSEWLTIGGAMRMGCTRPSWIASVVPLDDSVREIVEFHVRVEKVEHGQEGADVFVERLPTLESDQEHD